MIKYSGDFGFVERFNGQMILTNFFFSGLPIFPFNSCIYNTSTQERLKIHFHTYSLLTAYMAFGSFWILPILFFLLIYFDILKAWPYLFIIPLFIPLIGFFLGGNLSRKNRMRERLLFDLYLPINFEPDVLPKEIQQVHYQFLINKVKTLFGHGNMRSIYLSADTNLKYFSILYCLARYGKVVTNLAYFNKYLQENKLSLINDDEWSKILSDAYDGTIIFDEGINKIEMQEISKQFKLNIRNIIKTARYCLVIALLTSSVYYFKDSKFEIQITFFAMLTLFLIIVFYAFVPEMILLYKSKKDCKTIYINAKAIKLISDGYYGIEDTLLSLDKYYYDFNVLFISEQLKSKVKLHSLQRFKIAHPSRILLEVEDIK